MVFHVKKLSALRLCVTDLKVSRDWYSAFFDANPQEDLTDFVSFSLGSVILEITLADAKSPLSPGGSVGYWLVDHFEDAITKAIHLKATIYRGPTVRVRG